MYTKTMSTSLLDHIYYDGLHEELYFEPPIVIQVHPPRGETSGNGEEITVGEALGFAILQGLQKRDFEAQQEGLITDEDVGAPEVAINEVRESVVRQKDDFNAQIDWLVEIEDLEHLREVLHESFEIQGIHVIEVPVDVPPHPQAA